METPTFSTPTCGLGGIQPLPTSMRQTWASRTRVFKEHTVSTPSKRARSDDENHPNNSPNRNKSSLEPGYQNLSLEYWLIVTNSMKELKGKIEKLGKDNSLGEDKNFLSPIIKGFSVLEKSLTDLAEVSFTMARDVDSVCGRVDKLENIIKGNKASGDIVSKVEKSAAYNDSCKEVKNTELQAKVFNIDLGDKTSGNFNIVSKVKAKLGISSGNLGNVIIIPLRKESYESKISNELTIQTVPILFKAKSKDDKIKLDNLLREKSLKSSFHWPKDMIKPVKSIHAQMTNYKEGGIDLTNKQILIRPNFECGKFLIISTRPNTGGKWTKFISVKTPADSELVKKFKDSQPCHSAYFTL